MENKENMISIENLPHGDMPGDKIRIEQQHLEKTEVILPVLLRLLDEIGAAKTVVVVCGGSGVGKSEIASLLAYRLREAGRGVYVLSGDNYPHRIPEKNDAERLRVYEEGGKEALAAYLGSQSEIDFSLVQKIINDFKSGAAQIRLKRMGRSEDELWFDDVDFSGVDILIIEWTHGNSDLLSGVDIPILLNSTPEETLAHRRARARDGNVDSPFVTMVLSLEQDMLKAQAHKAKIIVSKQGELLSFDEYQKRMG